ncbi:hypothetical protein [Paenibacillus gorillae]|nr:hypothetical protein [Paenibacillus gorillae]
MNQYGGLQKNGGSLQNKRNQISETKWIQNGIDPPKKSGKGDSRWQVKKK